MLAIYSICNYKKKWNLFQNSPAVKKCAAPKKAIVKKDVKFKVSAKKWLDGRLIAKILITTIQVNFEPNPSEMWRRQHKFTWIVVIKILPLANRQAISWVPPWISHLFPQWPSWGPHTILQLGYFGLDSRCELAWFPIMSGVVSVDRHSCSTFTYSTWTWDHMIILCIIVKPCMWNMQLLWKSM